MPREEREGEDERKARTPYDLARMRLERLQQNPNKLAPIPQRKEDPKPKEPPEFVRNVVGSSAAAGSAEFHIYRNNRRKEMNRIDHMEKEYQKKKLDEEYEQKIEERRRIEEEKLEKNRRKRLKRKQREKERRQLKKKKDDTNATNSEDSNNDSGASDKEEENAPAKNKPLENEAAQPSDIKIAKTLPL